MKRLLHARLLLIPMALLALLVGVLVLAARPVNATLTEFLGLERSADQQRTRDLAVQQLIEQCMASKGLRYQAHVASLPMPPDPALSPTDWARKWGFGISTGARSGNAEGEPDPNQAYVATLSAENRSTYVAALVGESGASSAYGGGCTGSANERVHGIADRKLAPLATDMRRLQETARSDPRMSDAMSKWNECLAEKGLPAGPPSGAADRAIAQIQGALSSVETATGDPVDPARLEQVQELERTVATNLAVCVQALDDVSLAVRREIEGRFIQEHRDQLETLRQRILAEERALGIE
jgi:hypothetical protein